MTIYFTHINRLEDNMILTASLDDQKADYFKNEAQRYFSKLQTSSSSRLSYPTQHGTIHFCILKPVYAVCATNPDFEPPRAYQYLEESLQLFLKDYRETISAISGAFALMDFHVVLDQLNSKYCNQIKNQSIKMLTGELNTVRQSMARNIESAFDRGAKVNEVGDIAGNLNTNSVSFKRNATDLNRLHLWRTYGRPSVIVAITALVYFLVSLVL